MSYILEALRRADAERQRGQVPGLHAQPVAAVAAPSAPPAPAWALIAAVALAVLVLAAGLWWFWPGGEARVADADTAVARSGPALPEPGAAPSMPAAADPAAATAAATAAGGEAEVPTLPVVVSSPPRAAPPAAAAPADPSAAPPAPAAAVPAAPAPRVLKLADLPADVRRELPPLAVSGAIWSDSPASRFVMINGQVVREGELAAPGVLVERIDPRAAVLRWREWRLELPF